MNATLRTAIALAGVLGLSAGASALRSTTTRAGGADALRQEARLRVTVVRMPYVGERNTAELSSGPDALIAGGLLAELERAGAQAVSPTAVRLSPEQERQYGAWQRLALANGNLADTVASAIREGRLVVGLQANCSSLLGMLGGMDVAAAAGLCLTRLRTTSKLDPPVPVANMILAGVRDADPLEQELIDRLKVPQLTVADLQARGEAFRRTYAALSARVSRIYVHIDMDVLDPAEVPGHSLNVKGGPTSAELADAVAEMFKDPKAVAIGIASTPTGERDAEGRSRKAAYTLIRAAVRGVRARR
jgi:arginase